MKKYLLTALLMLAIFSLLSAEDKFDTVKNPTKAALLSLALPGGGQFYNESYYKAVGVGIIESSLIATTIYHTQQTNHYEDKKNHATDPLVAANYKTLYDRNNRRLQNDYWWLGATILLSTIDAYVDANLYNFESEKKKVHMRFSQNSLQLSYSF